MDVKLISNQWDESTQKIVIHPEPLVLNTYIQEVKVKVDAVIIELMRESEINGFAAAQIKAKCIEELDPNRKKAIEDKTTFLYRFMKYAERMKPGSINIHFRNIRIVFNEAIEDGITNFYPFRRFRIKNEVTAKRDLSVEELRRLAYFDCEDCAVKYRDCFMLMLYLMSINNLEKREVHNFGEASPIMKDGFLFPGIASSAH